MPFTIQSEYKYTLAVTRKLSNTVQSNGVIYYICGHNGKSKAA